MIFVKVTTENRIRLTYYVFVRGNMKKNSNLILLDRHRHFCLLCSFVAVVIAMVSTARAEDAPYYDSSLQRSNFSYNPSYEKNLEETLKKERRSVFLWKLRFDGESLQTDQNIQSQNVGAAFRAKYSYRLLENLDFKAKANMVFQSGRSQDLFGDLEPDSGVYPQELRLAWSPWKDRIEFSVGQINQFWFNEPLFIGGNAGFPGVSQTFKLINTDDFKLRVVTQQLIPTSTTLSTRVTEKERTPYLFTESLEANWSISRNNWLMGRVSHFNYDNLPRIVAFRSFIYGNTVTNTDQNNARFIYDFNGYIYQMAFEQKISNPLSAQVQWNTIVNSKAPSSAGEAQSLKFFLANDFGRWIGGLSYTDYFIESDAVPAVYNSHRLGHNNRIGHSVELNIESKDWGVIFRTQYTKANLLSDSLMRIDGLQQDNQQTFYLSVESMYDFI